MAMRRRACSALVGLVVFAPLPAAAQIIISEIMYDLSEGSDSGREWIEVYNAAATPVSLPDWKVSENGTNHKIAAVAGGAALAPGAYAVIADNTEKFKADHPSFSGQLFDSVFSLSNTGESIALRDPAGADIDAVTYSNTMGGSGTGDSLQRTQLQPDAAFSAGIPTPGVGISTGGLAKTPQKENKSTTSLATKTSSKKEPSPAATGPVIIGKPAKEVLSGVESQVAGVASAPPAPSSTRYLWWLGMLAIASMGAVGVAWSRRIKRTEWEIEEIS